MVQPLRAGRGDGPAALKRGKGLAVPMAPRRLPGRPEDGPVPFRWGRARVQGREGDTVASALLGAGHSILARSIKYHRPRSVLCGVGKCAGCLVTIDGKPSQRACITPLRAGMAVEPQNCWPSAAHDLFGLSDALLPRGFDPQRSFTRPRFLTPLYYGVVRRMAGLGRAPMRAARPRPGPVSQEAADLVVVGAGPAGLAAALEAARAGVQVRLLDERPWPGGRLAHEGGLLQGPDELAGRRPDEAMGALLAELRSLGVQPALETTAAGVYPGLLLAVQTPRRLTEVRAGALVLATGAPEALPLFGGNDRPGVMSCTAAALLLRRHGVLPGKRVVLAGADARALDLGRALARAGASVDALVAPEAPEGHDLRVVRGEVVRALGSRWVSGVVLRVGGDTMTLACDLLVFSEPRRPSVELAQQAGCSLAWQGGALAPQASRGVATTLERVFAAGDLVAPGSLEAALASGALAGLRAAQALGAKADEARLEHAEHELAAYARPATSPAVPFAAPEGAGRAVRSLVCPCEDLAAGDIAGAVDLGHADLESVKRYTGVATGPCQGKQCLLSCQRLLSGLTGLPPEQVGSIVHRPPVSPLPLGLLAGEVEE